MRLLSDNFEEFDFLICQFETNKLHMTLFMWTGDFQPHHSLPYHQTDVSARSSYPHSDVRARSCAHPTGGKEQSVLP